MSSILYYPNYTPSRRQLRSLLLYYEQVKTIVPRVDQYHVRARDHIQEVLEVGEDLVDFVDPTQSLRPWNELAEGDDVAVELANRCSEEARGIPEIRHLRTDRGGLAFPPDDLLERMYERGWKIVAQQKIPDELLEHLMERGIGIPLGVARNPETGATIEENPILMPRELADFTVTRVARDISQQQSVTTFSFDEQSFGSHIYKGNEERRSVLLSLILPLAIPPDIESLEPAEFSVLREITAETRAGLQNQLQDLLTEKNLDSETDAARFLDKGRSMVSDICRRVDGMENALGRQRWHDRGNLALQIVLSAAGAYIGNLIGDTEGSVAGAALGPIAGKVTERLGTLRPTADDSELVQSLACVRGKIDEAIGHSLELPGFMSLPSMM